MSSEIKILSSNLENLRMLAESCDVNMVLVSIGLRWKMQILYSISKDVYQFSKLKKIFPTISDQVLGKRIKELCSEGLIIKIEIPHKTPPQIRYDVTEKGKELLSIVLVLHQWEKKWNQA
ncbi:MAG TPA: helix-turn-helix domain-containing protein [Sediminibacterium sp.]|nr:helix-turn-helix domain-containing protein [Sediminibacterium sp.]